MNTLIKCLAGAAAGMLACVIGQRLGAPWIVSTIIAPFVAGFLVGMIGSRL